MAGMTDAEVFGDTPAAPLVGTGGMSDAEVFGVPRPLTSPLASASASPTPLVTPTPVTTPTPAVAPAQETPPTPQVGMSDAEVFGSPSDHYSVTRGFVTHFTRDEPQSLSNTLEGLSYLAPSYFKESLQSASKSVGSYSATKGGYETIAPKLKDIRGLDDALTWAGETIGSGLGSTAAPIALGAAGAAAGTPLGPVGEVAGGLGGAVLGGSYQNYGEVYQALKDSGVEPERAAKVSAAVLPVLSALDAAGVVIPGVKLLGSDLVKKGLTKFLGKTLAESTVKTAEGGVLKTAGKEASIEAGTEAGQELTKQAAITAETGKPLFSTSNAWDLLENALGGALVGGPVGGAAHAVGGHATAKVIDNTPPTPEAIAGAFKEYNGESTFNPEQLDILRRMIQRPAGAEPGADVQVGPEGTRRAMLDPSAPSAEQTGPGPLWYSKAEKAVEGLPESGTAQQMRGTLLNMGVRQDELTWTGLDEFFHANGADIQTSPHSIMTEDNTRATSELLQWRHDNPGQKPPGEMLQAAQEERVALQKLKGEAARAQAGAPKVTRQDILNHLQENQYKLKEEVRDDIKNPPTPQEMALRQKQADFYDQLTSMDGVLDDEDNAINRPENRAQRHTMVSQWLEINRQLHLVSEQLPAASAKAAPGYAAFVTPGERHGYATIAIQVPENDRVIDIMSDTEHRYGEDELRRAGGYNPPHFSDDIQTYRNTIGHGRITIREDSSGQLVAHIEELQSDWMQVARRFGFITKKLIASEIAALKVQDEAHDAFVKATNHTAEMRIRNAVETEDSRSIAMAVHEVGITFANPEVSTLASKYVEAYKARRAISDKIDDAVADAPYKMTRDWTRLLMKRILRWAADKGIQRVTWNNPELAYQYPTGARGGARSDPSEMTPPEKKRFEGMKKYYGQTIPSIAKELARQYGGDVGVTNIQVGTPGTQPAKFSNQVGYVDFDRRAQWNFQRSGFPQFMLDPQMVPAAVQPTIPNLKIYEDQSLFDSPVRTPVHEAARKFGDALEEIVQKFKFKGNVALVLRKELRPTLGMTALAYHSFNAQTNQHSIEVNVGAFESMPFGDAVNVSKLWAVLMHEFGHAVMDEHYDRLPASTKLAIMAAYDKFLAETGKLRTLGERMSHRMSGPYLLGGENWGSRDWNSLPPAQRDYWSSFDEWFADQVGKWGTTSDRALSIVERAIKGIRDAMMAIFSMLSRRLGVNLQPEQAMREWLDSFMTSNEGFTHQLHLKMDAQNVISDQRMMSAEEPDMFIPPRSPQADTIKLSAMAALGGSHPGVSSSAVHAARINWIYKFMGGLVHLAEANPLFAPLQRYTERMRRMHLDETNIHDAALRVRKDWRALGVQSENLAAFINDLVNLDFLSPTEKAAGIVRQPNAQEQAALVAKHKLSNAGLEVFRKIKVLNDYVLDLTTQSAMKSAMRTIHDPVVLANKIDEIRYKTDALKSKPFFPFMRFGRHYIIAKNSAGQTIHFETFERMGLRSAESQQTRRAGELATQFPGATIDVGVLPEAAAPFVGMSPMFLEEIRNKLNLTPSQNDALENLMYDHSTATKFPRAFKQNYIKGYSMDFQRSFARYFFYAGRYYARSEHAWELNDDIRQARLIGGTKASEIANFMSDHLKNTVLEAKGDFGILKGGIFLWAMGYVPSAATQNLTQTPMITFPFLGGKFGDFKATRAITKAMTQMSSFYKRGAYEKTGNLEMDALDYGIKHGIITESQASELAAAAQGMNLLRGIGGNAVMRGWQAFMEKSAWMFEMAEQWNRRIAYRASYNLAMENPNSQIVKEAVAAYKGEYDALFARTQNAAHAAAVITASYITTKTQYEYARWARARVMRGKLPGTLFVFKTYMLNTLWMLGNNKSDVLPRFIMMSVLLGGLAGIPGYEDLRDIMKALGHWFSKDFDVEKAMRQFVLSHFDGRIPPDMILGGMSRRGYGIPALLDMLGSFATGTPGRGFDGKARGQNVPFPVLDRHHAITMGPLLPVELGKLFDPTDDVNRTLADQSQRASGAVFSVGFNIYKAIMDNKLAASDPKRWERAIPRQLADITRTWRAFNEGRERSRGGVNSAPTIAEFNWRDSEQAAEMLAMSLGYQPLRTQAKWDSIMAKAESTKFFEMQQKTLFGQLFEARRGGDPKEVSDVLESIKRFNRELPQEARGYSITRENATQSIKGRQRELIARESGIPSQKRNIPISKYIDTLFPETTVDVRRIR